MFYGTIEQQLQPTDYMKTITKKEKGGKRKGFTLIELMVAIFIFSVILTGILSVSVSILNAYQKARAIKTVKESADFALSSIAKDVRMGRIEKFTVPGVLLPPSGDGINPKEYFAVTRNRDQIVACYHIYVNVDISYLGVITGTPGSVNPLVSASCPSDNGTNYTRIVDLTGTGMNFDPATSGFYSLTTDPPTAPTRRGWAEINLNIKSDTGKEMEADQINVQTVVSSRDYGWAEAN